MLQTTGEERNQSAQHSDGLEGLKARIAKARWAGMDQEAEKLCHELKTKAPEACVPQCELETD